MINPTVVRPCSPRVAANLPHADTPRRSIYEAQKPTRNPGLLAQAEGARGPRNPPRQAAGSCHATRRQRQTPGNLRQGGPPRPIIGERLSRSHFPTGSLELCNDRRSADREVARNRHARVPDMRRRDVGQSRREEEPESTRLQVQDSGVRGRYLATARAGRCSRCRPRRHSRRPRLSRVRRQDVGRSREQAQPARSRLQVSEQTEGAGRAGMSWRHLASARGRASSGGDARGSDSSFGAGQIAPECPLVAGTETECGTVTAPSSRQSGVLR